MRMRICARVLMLILMTVTWAAVAEQASSVLPPPRHGGVYVVAHRGAHEGIPENTLAAYRKAIELGADYVEIDVRETKDGRFVSIHNSTVDGYTKEAKGPVKDFTLAELRALDIGSRVGPQWNEERIPVFEDILDLCKGKIGIYLDLKNAPVEKLIPLIKARGMERDVIWYAGLVEQKQVRDLCPECIPMPDPGPEKMLGKLLERFKPRVVASSWENMSESFIRSCHAAGAIVIMDDDGPDCWEKALGWGLDGIQTDHPEALIKFIQERK